MKTSTPVPFIDESFHVIPKDREIKFVRINGHGFLRDALDRLYTVYRLEMQCQGHTWTITRRYGQFLDLMQRLQQLDKAMELYLELFPRKKLIGSFDPIFLSKRQTALGRWLERIMNERLSGPQWNVVRTFCTPDQIPPPCVKRTTLNDFEMKKVLGQGSFGLVVLVIHKETQHPYAMKILTKANIIQRDQVEHTKTERRVLGCTRHPFILPLRFAFQTRLRLFFVLDYCPGGELFYHLNQRRRFPESMARFYAAEIILALEHLHNVGVVYRDLKPENILLDQEGHVQMIDFGLSKEGITHASLGTNSLCGTPEYLPPEILDQQGHGTAVDWWNLGMVLFEMLTGLPPWYTQNRLKLFERIRSAPIAFPCYVSPVSQSLIRELLERDPSKRLGSHNGGAAEIKTHAFFSGINWSLLYERKISPPIQPCPVWAKKSNNTSTMIDTWNFSKEFTTLPLPILEFQDDELSGSSMAWTNAGSERPSSGLFSGFTYINPHR